jgi:hypothetical protein
MPKMGRTKERTMSETTARKAVVTTAQVQEALNSYKAVTAELGNTHAQSWEFDKGARGKGFAVYSGNDVAMTFDTKEDALNHFGTYVKVAREVIDMIKAKEAADATEQDETKTTTRKATQKSAA